MKPNSLIPFKFIVFPLIILLVHSPHAQRGIAGETYRLDRKIKIRALELKPNGAVRFLFFAKPERNHFCPGVNVNATDVPDSNAPRIEVSFVRARKHEVAEVMFQTQTLQEGSEDAYFVDVPADGKPVFVRYRGRPLMLTSNDPSKMTTTRNK